MKAETAQAGIKKRSSPDTAGESSNKPVKAASTSGEAVAVASVKRDDAIAVPVFGLDPPGPNGQYLSNADIKEIVQVPEKSLDTVKRWILSECIFCDIKLSRVFFDISPELER